MNSFSHSGVIFINPGSWVNHFKRSLGRAKTSTERLYTLFNYNYSDNLSPEIIQSKKSLNAELWCELLGLIKTTSLEKVQTLLKKHTGNC